MLNDPDHKVSPDESALKKARKCVSCKIRRMVKLIFLFTNKLSKAASLRIKNVIILLFKHLNTFAEVAYRFTTRPFFKIKGFAKEISEIEGFIAKCRRIAQVAAYQVRSGRITLRKFLNYAAPATAIITLMIVVHIVTGQEYALAVNYNGTVIAYVSNEAEFNKALAVINSKLVNVDDSEKFDVGYVFSLTNVSGKDNVIEYNELAQIIINESDNEIVSAKGLYVNGEFYGASEEHASIEATLNNILEEYQQRTETTDACFEDDVVLKEGLYYQNNVTSEDELLSLITSNKEGEQIYTVVEGESPSQIAGENDVSISLLRGLNPEISEEEGLQPGQAVNIVSSEPFLSVTGYKEIEYEAELAFETVVNDDPTIFENESTVAQEGSSGVQKVTAIVKLVDGEEAGREIIASEITVQPINKIVVQGSKALPEGSTVVSAASGSNTLEGISFIRPLQGAGTVSRGITRYHSGVDLAAPSGTPIYASAAGTVTLASWYSGYGNCVMVSHGNGVVTLYGHMSAINATEGEKVAKGQLIGYVGTTGNSSGNHLHFEIRYNGSKLDPFDYVSR